MVPSREATSGAWGAQSVTPEPRAFYARPGRVRARGDLPTAITAPRQPLLGSMRGTPPPRSAVPSDPTSREYRDSVGMFTTGITVVTAVSERFGV